MVMPCSRSASKPSVKLAKSKVPPALRLLSCATWSASKAWLSYSKRPIKVDLPSSTLPAVMKRNTESVVLIACVPCLQAAWS